MTIQQAKADLEKFVKLKTTQRPVFVDVILAALESSDPVGCRCKDCHYRTGSRYCEELDRFTEDDGFCCWGYPEETCVGGFDSEGTEVLDGRSLFDL